MPQVSGSTLVAVRLFKGKDVNKSWEEIPESSFLPVFVSGDLYQENITKRLMLMYFKYPSDLVKIRWNLRETPEEGFWLESPFQAG